MEILRQLGIEPQLIQDIQLELTELYEVLSAQDAEIEKNNFIINEDSLKKINPVKLISVPGSIREYRLLIESAIEKEIDIFDTPSLLSHFLKQLNLSCPSDFIETLSKNNQIVEAFNLEHIQIFRNLTFMKLCSYSLADVLTYEWPDLFERSQMVTNSLLEKVVYVTENLKSVPLDTEIHYMKERFSHTGRVHKVDFGHLGPLLDEEGKLAGYISSSKAKIIDKSPEEHGLRFI